jgi:DNA-directed RNA polymerase specialized sigma24 family protein
MSANPSSVPLYERLMAGDSAALGEVHAQYWDRLMAIVCRRLSGPKREYASDVVASAMKSFVRLMKDDEAAKPNNEDHLGALLVTIAVRKAINLARRAHWKTSQMDDAAHQPAGRDKTPFEEAMLNDAWERYVTRLPEGLRGYAERHLRGQAIAEIAVDLDVSERTVERKLALVREQWQAWAATQGD